MQRWGGAGSPEVTSQGKSVVHNGAAIQPVFDLEAPQLAGRARFKQCDCGECTLPPTRWGRRRRFDWQRNNAAWSKRRERHSFIIMAAPSAFAFYRSYVQLVEMSERLRNACFHTDFFQFDDYPLPAHHPASFRYLLLKHFFIPLAPYCDPAKVHLFEADAADPDAAASRYEELLLRHGLDLQIMGIGENGHWGFHEPGISLEIPPRFLRVDLTKENVDQQMRDHPQIFKSPEDVRTLGLHLQVCQCFSPPDMPSKCPAGQ